MQALSLRGSHVHYSVRGPNSCFKKREEKLGPYFLVRRGVDLYAAALENFFISNFRVSSSVEPYAAA